MGAYQDGGLEYIFIFIYFYRLAAHAKFQNPTTTLSGIIVTMEREEERLITKYQLP
jgi:hypothetical protein